MYPIRFLRLAEFTAPPLTTVQMSQAELARLAFVALINHVEAAKRQRRRDDYSLATSLILRGSTALAT